MARTKTKLTVGKIIGRVLIVFFTTLILLVIALYLLMLVIAKGPSNTAKKLFVCTVKETSAIGFLANWYYTDEEIEDYLGSFRSNTTDEVTNAELVQIAPKTSEGGAAAEDGASAQKETELIEVTGSTYKGKLLKIKDPSRVFVGVSGPYGQQYEGKRVMDMMNEYGAQAAINAGGFEDLNGVGNGGTPLGIVISQGEFKWGTLDQTYELIGFDSNNILHVGNMTGQQAKDLGIRDAVQFGPLLIVNGKPANEVEPLGGGFNPRSAIGQTADGTVLLLVIDGRQATSLGATYDDVISILLKHGAVNAANLDGGSSSHMIYEGEFVTVCSSLYGPRRMPTCWLVAPES
ncbi:MAG: phosphodiester glycosidase family protein [Oscillospiraceae bacterium]|nr:phosphodiester glycosidase family protein [Oscillospiraceae bacterium]